MPQVDIDGANSKVSADTIRGQSGTTVTVLSGHNLVGSGSGLTALPAANLTGTLPAISATNLTNIPAANLTGTLPAISGASLTNLPASTTIKIGFFSKNIADATGTLAITGVGFQPTVVMFFATVSGGTGFSVGSNDLTTMGAFYSNQASSDNTWGNISAATIMMEKGSSNQYKGVVNSMDADGFTIGWTKVGSPTGTMQVTWHAMR